MRPAVEVVTVGRGEQFPDTVESAVSKEVVGELAPMPCEPPSNLLRSVGYTYRVTLARVARARAVRDIRKQLQKQTAQLERAMGDLGYVVRHSAHEVQGVAHEKESLIALEGVRIDLQGAIEQLDRQRQQAQTHFQQARSDVDARKDVASSRIEEAQQQLSDHLTQEAARRDELAQHDRRIKTSERQRDEARATAGGLGLPHEQEDAQRQAAEKAVEIGDWLQAKAEISRQLGLLQEPIEELKRTIQQARVALQQCHRDLAVAKQELTGTRRQIDADERRQKADIARADQEIDKQLVELGRAAYRRGVPEGLFADQLAQVVAGWQTVAAQQDEIKRLTAESDSFDKRTHRWGAVLLIASAALLLVTPLVLWLR